LIGLAGLSLAGCAATPIPTTVDMPGMPNAEIALQKSMDDVGREMDRIGKMGPEAATSNKPVVVPGELDRQVSFQWNGSLDDAVRELARTVGYRTIVSGPMTAARVRVSIDPAPRRVYDILRMLGEQAGATAMVHVDPQHQRVEVAVLPRTDQEVQYRMKFVAEGWGRGEKQAVDIFLADLGRLQRDIVGMARYQVLLKKRLVENPKVVFENSMVNGGGAELRAGDRVVRITAQPGLRASASSWSRSTRDCPK